MKKTVAILMALVLAMVSAAAFAENTAEDNHHYETFTDAEGNLYDMFVITKMNYGADHKVTSVTGHFERVVIGEEEYEKSSAAPDSEKTYTLAADFRADMVDSMTGSELTLVPVTDLYEWYIDAYIGRDQYDGHEWVFTCDLPAEEWDTATADFWFVTTKIELNDQGEIQYMQYVYVPWA